MSKAQRIWSKKSCASRGTIRFRRRRYRARHSVTTTAIDLDDQRANAARRARWQGQGLMEAVTWSFMPHKIAEQFGAVDAGLPFAKPDQQ